MSNTKHTPGPWANDPNGTGAVGDISTADGELCVAQAQQTSPSGRPDPARDANARLIAAAPELLEALKKIVECERKRAKDLQHRKAWLPLKFSEERISAAEAAVAKAEGDE